MNIEDYKPNASQTAVLLTVLVLGLVAGYQVTVTDHDRVNTTEPVNNTNQSNLTGNDTVENRSQYYDNQSKVCWASNKTVQELENNSCDAVNESG
jgi:hypothetical protein